MIYRSFIAEKKLDPHQDNIARGVITTNDPDRSGDVVIAKGANLDNYLKNPVVLFNHGRDFKVGGRPIAKTIDVQIKNKKIEAQWEWASHPEAQEIKNMWNEHMINALSIGFKPLKVEEIPQEDNEASHRFFPPLKFLEWELLEYSVVTIGMNAKALRKKAYEELDELIDVVPSLKEYMQPTFEFKEFKDQLNYIQSLLQQINNKHILALPDEMVFYFNSGIHEQNIEKAVVPFKAWPTADQATVWDGSAAVRALRTWAGGPDKDNIDWGKYRQGFAIYNPDDKTNFGSYKLPHHDIKNGEMKTIFKGCVAAIVVINGGRGGLTASDAEKRGAYNHIAKHYKQFDETPPEFNPKSWDTNKCEEYLKKYNFDDLEICDVINQCNFENGTPASVPEQIKHTNEKAKHEQKQDLQLIDELLQELKFN